MISELPNGNNVSTICLLEFTPKPSTEQKKQTANSKIIWSKRTSKNLEFFHQTEKIKQLTTIGVGWSTHLKKPHARQIES